MFEYVDIAREKISIQIGTPICLQTDRVGQNCIWISSEIIDPNLLFFRNIIIIENKNIETKLHT